MVAVEFGVGELCAELGELRFGFVDFRFELSVIESSEG